MEYAGTKFKAIGGENRFSRMVGSHIEEDVKVGKTHAVVTVMLGGKSFVLYDVEPTPAEISEALHRLRMTARMSFAYRALQARKRGTTPINEGRYLASWALASESTLAALIQQL